MANDATSLPPCNDFQHDDTPAANRQEAGSVPTLPVGAPREFSDDGCFVGPYFRASQ
jgi:hypothetical protein